MSTDPAAPGPSFPRYATHARVREVVLVRPGPLPPAPYAGVETDLVRGRGHAALHLGDWSLSARAGRGGVVLQASHAGRRLDVPAGPRTRWRRWRTRTRTAEVLALTLTGPCAVAWTRDADGWTARARLDLAGAPGTPVDPTGPGGVHDPAVLATLRAEGDRHGAFGGLGLRDPRLVTHADGTPWREGDDVLVTATSAGPGGFRTGHTSVWAFHTGTGALTHRGDLFARRGGAVVGDHAVHLVREDDGWLLATSTWGDFDLGDRPRVGVGLARTRADVTRGTHVLDTEPLPLPTGPHRSVGVWDPHLRRDADGVWHVAFVSATRFFDFHPVLARGTELSGTGLTWVAAASDRHACEGVTWARDTTGRWWLLASEGGDGVPEHRLRYPVFDAGLRAVATLGADFPGNIPWPTLLPGLPGSPGNQAPWMMGFDGVSAGGPVLPYGTHGALVLQRPVGGGDHPGTPGDHPSCH